MEKIKQALERAREQRQFGAPESQPSSKKHNVGSRSEAGEITYSDTRVVQIDPIVLKRNRILLGTEQTTAASAYKILRTQVEQRLAAKGWNSIAVTSPGTGDGKTLTAINLSIALAREVHRTVLLVDLDLKNPSVHKRFEQNDSAGIVDYLIDDIPLNEILLNPGIEHLVILPAGRSMIGSSELLSSPKMISLVEELKSRYPSRIIVFDLPPLLSSDDMLAFSPYVDTTLLVVDDGATTKDELVQAVEMLQDVHLLGTVLNRSSDPQVTYY